MSSEGTTKKKRKKRRTSTRPSGTGRTTLEERLIENIVLLQKANTDMSEKFDRLADQISSLLALFESAARSFAKHPGNQVAEKDKEFLDKIDRLLEQNKVIAKGLTLMEQKIREKIYGPIHSGGPPMSPRPRQQF